MAELDTIRKIAVLGAGQMGSGIAQVLATSGYEVSLSDIDLARAEQGKANIATQLARGVAKARLSRAEADAILARIIPGDWEALASCDFAIEAATEQPELKFELFARLDAKLKAGAILASNTSSISITKLAACTKRPERVIGMHFMNPVPLMKLVEVVVGTQTRPETTRAVRTLAEKLGKTVIISQDHPGFVVNRMLLPLLNEACFSLQEGLASAEDIDTGARLGLNHPMGPLELADLIGLDTVLAIAEVLLREFGDDKYRPATILRNYVAAGWHGKKSGRGFYCYDPAGNKIAPSAT